VATFDGEFWRISAVTEIEFRESACKKKKFKLEKLFKVLKNKNHLTEIKESFSIPLKMFSI
jgi:hypothetical protein